MRGSSRKMPAFSGVMLVCLREISVFLGRCFAAAGESQDPRIARVGRDP